MADQVITRQELIDAQKDAQSLDDFINGGDEQIVVTRLLKEYPTLANAIRQIYEKGGKFYPTLAAANADIANIRTDVYVITGDNGAYYKATAEDTTLTKSDYDPLTQAKTYADQGIKDYISGQSYTGPIQVIRNGVIWELPEGQTSSGTEAQSPGFDPRWIRKTYANTMQKLDRKYAPYVSINGAGSSADVFGEYAQKVDDAIKSILLVGGEISNFKYASLTRFNIFKKSDGTAQVTIYLNMSKSLSNVTDDIQMISSSQVKIDEVGHCVVYGANRGRLFFEMALDLSGFEQEIQYKIEASKEASLLHLSSIKIQDEPFFKHNINEPYNAGASYFGNPFALHRALKNISLVGNQDGKYLRFTKIEKNATSVTVDITVFDAKDNTTTLFRKIIPNADFSGLMQISPTPISGIKTRSLDFYVALSLDADYLNRHYGAATYKIEPIDPNVALTNMAQVREILSVNTFDMAQPGFADYRGMWYATGTYKRMAIGKRIPTGATSLRASGIFDKNANILFGDVNGQLIHGGYAWKNEDGTKYSGDDTKTELIVPIPEGAYYFHMSTLATSVNTAALYFIGDFKAIQKSDFDTVQAALLDSTVQNGVYTAGKYLFRKNGSDVNTIEVIDGSNLALADTYKASGLKQGKSQGQLAFYKDGKYYYYHGSNREIYVEENGIKTTLTSPTLHPAAWTLSIGQQQERTVLEVLSDNSVLFAMKERQTDGNITYSLWKMEVGQEPVRCFMYSNDFFTKPDTSVQSANGCPLGEWSFAYAEGLIFATEYGEGTSKWWFDQAGSGGNGKGVSSRVWVSNDNGNTWYICLNLNELKNPALPQSDSNWKYFSDTNAKNYCHIHMIKYDNYDKRVYISNGDGENYLWSIDIASVKTWLTSAVAINPTALPIYTQATGLTWNAVRLCTYQNQPNINYHNMKFQMTALYPIEQGLLMGHDAPREFMYLAHRKGILSQSTFRFEPTYNWERWADFNTEAEFKNSTDVTNGFVMSMARFSKADPILSFHSASGKYCRIWATYNGFNNRIVFESELKEITFGCRVFFDDKGNIILSTGAGTTAINSGYYLLSINRT